MKKTLSFFLFIASFAMAQLNSDSISYHYFYKKELQEIVQLKKQIKSNPQNLKKQIALAELYQNINAEDSAYATYYRVFETNKNNLNPEAYKKVVFALHKIESSKNEYHKDRRYFLNLLCQASKNDVYDKWKAKYYNEIAQDYLLDSSKTKQGFYYYNKVLKTHFYQDNDTFQTKMCVNLGNYYEHQKQFAKADSVLKLGVSKAIKNKDNLDLIYCYINLAVNANLQKKYNQAINYLNLAEKTPNKQFKPKIFRIIYQLKGDAYYGLKNNKQVTHCDKIVAKLDSIIDDFKKNSNFYEIDVKYQTEEKNKQIFSLSQLINMYHNNKILYLSLIFIIFILALYSFIRWKKVDRVKQKLFTEKEKIEIEHTSTIQELEKIKQLVIEDHIVLKNKTKIYLNELLYIKSDDHYLEFYTIKKKEFLRGKISEIIGQLPPNFVQTHRSYIINKNYLTQSNTNSVFLNGNIEIPVSRNYLKNIKP